MSNSVPFNLDAPGTYIYTGEMASKGYQLTRFGLSLRKPENREKFLADEAGYMRAAGLSEDEIALVRARDWTGLIQAGGHLRKPAGPVRPRAVESRQPHLHRDRSGSATSCSCLCHRPFLDKP